MCNRTTIIMLILPFIAAPARAIPNPAAVYCTELGYTYDNGECVFPDGSRCSAWHFYCKCEPNGTGCTPGDYDCNWPCQELACKQAGESVLVGQCCEGLQEIPPTYIYDGNCDDNGMTGWSYLCSDCGNGICESWESACNCPNDCTGQAHAPVPPNNSRNFCTGDSLTWSMGIYVDNHNVYFGTSLSYVNEGATPVATHVVANTWDPPGELTLNTTYYWRVDTVNDACAPYVWEGGIWSFTTTDGNAFALFPEDGQDNVTVDSNLFWACCEADSYNVYFSQDFNDVNDRLPWALQEIQYTDAEWDPCSGGHLEYRTAYYWAMDKIQDGMVSLGHVWTFTTESRPLVDPNLLLWYRLDEAYGDVAHDSSGRDHDGIVDYYISPDPNWDPNGGLYGGCLIFNNDTRIELPPDVLDPIDDGITVSVWLKGAFVQDYDNWVFDTGYNTACRMQVLLDGYTEQIVWRAGNDACDVLVCDWSDIPTPRCWYPGDWHWFIFLKDETEDRISIYVDCALVASADNVDDTLINLRGAPFTIGALTSHSNDLIGEMDDFRIYDYAVSEGDIAMGCFFLDPLALAWNPEPSDGEVNVPPDANLTWLPGDYALQHNVFFGRTWEDVNSMTDPCAIRALGEELHAPGPLDLDTSYFWRIDEVNGPNTWKGCVWDFTTANYIVLDDFEMYTSEQALLDCWVDQHSQPLGQATGSWLSLVNSPVHTGSQAMKYWYDTDDQWADVSYAEAWRIFEGNCPGPQDWTQRNIKILTLFFYGDADNDANETEQMYVGVTDSDGFYGEARYGDHPGEDLGDLKVPEWQRWDIPLVWLRESIGGAANDVNLANVASVHIGFGSRRNPVAGGEGIVCFDDLRLYQPICRPEYGPSADLTGDCILDGQDLHVMTEDWLRHDVNFPDLGIDVQEPCDANLIGHWELDEGDGSTAGDSSDYNNPGTLEGDYSWIPGRIGPNAIDFAGGRALVPDDGNTPELRPQHQVSTSAWIYYDQPQFVARVLVKGADDFETFILLADEDELVFHMCDVNGVRYGTFAQIWQDEWIHIAGTYNSQQIKCHVNGLVQNSEDIGPIVLSQDTSGLAIGNRTDDMMRPFIGRIDDVRVYDCGLSTGEVAWLATEGVGYIPLVSPANIYDEERRGEKAVNFRDFALLADMWLRRQLWPAE